MRQRLLSFAPWMGRSTYPGNTLWVPSSAIAATREGSRVATLRPHGHGGARHLWMALVCVSLLSAFAVVVPLGRHSEALASSLAPVAHDVANVETSPNGTWQALLITNGSAQSFMISNNGGTWQTIATPSLSTSTVGAFTISDSGELYVSMNDSYHINVYRYLSSAWSGPYTIAGSGQADVLVTTDSTLVAFDGYANSYTSVNDGASWTEQQPLTGGYPTNAFYSALIGQSVYFVFGTLYGTTDYARWDISSGSTAVNGPLPGVFQSASVQPVLLSSPGSTSTLYIATTTWGNGLYLDKSTNSGMTWTNLLENDPSPLAFGNCNSGVCQNVYTGFSISADGLLHAYNSSYASGSTSLYQISRPLNNLSQTWSAVTDMATVTSTGSGATFFSTQQANGGQPAGVNAWVSVPDGTSTTDTYWLQQAGSTVSEVGATNYTANGSLVASNLTAVFDTVASPSRTWQAALDQLSNSGGEQVILSDDGVHWEQLADPSSFGIQAIAVNDEGELWVLTQPTPTGAGSDIYQFRSGRWYGPVTLGPLFGTLATILWVGNVLVGVTTSGVVYYSNDGGDTWEASTQPLWGSQNLQYCSFASLGVVLHALCDNSQGVVYARWSATTLDPLPVTTPPVLPASANPWTLAANLQTSSQVWVAYESNGTIGLDETIDNGNTWTTVDSGTAPPTQLGTVGAFALNAAGRMTVFGVSISNNVATALSADRSLSATANWSAVSTIGSAPSYSSSVETTPGTLESFGVDPDVWMPSLPVGGPADVYHFGPWTGSSPPLGGLIQPFELFTGGDGHPCVACAIKAAEASPIYATRFAGDPVNTATGDLAESTTDAHVATYGPPLDFTRYYNSELAEGEATSGSGLSPGPLGYGWSEPWDASLSFSTGQVTVYEGSGTANYFYATQSGACPATPSGLVDPLGASNPGTYCAAPRESATLSLSGSTYTFGLRNGTKYTFTSAGQLTAITDSNGAAQSITYNSPTPSSTSSTCNTSYATTVSCETITGPGSSGDRKLVLAFNAASDGGHIVRVTDPALRQWIYTYDTAGDLSTVSDPRGYETRYGYGNDSGSSNTAMNHDLVTIIRAKNYAGASGLGGSALSNFCSGSAGAPGYEMAFCYTYNPTSASYGQVVKQGDPMRRMTTFAYTYNPNAGSAGYNSAQGGYTTITDPDGNVTTDTYHYDELTSESVSPIGGATSTWTYTRDPATLLPIEIVDPAGAGTSMTYDSLGDMTSRTNSLGQSWTWSYNSFGEATCASLPEATSGCQSLSPPAAVSASNTTITPPSSAPPAYVTYSEYDTDGDPVWTSSGQYAPGGSSANTSTAYDLYNGQSVTIAGSNDSCAASAPEHGLACATVSPSAVDTETGAKAVTELAYDTDGDLTSSTIPDGNSGGETSETAFTYNADGQVLTEIAPLGNIGTGNGPAYTTAYTYNPDGDVTALAEGTGSAKRTSYYGYDTDDNVTSVENALTGTTTTTYDADDEANLVTDPDSNATLTCYDGDGNVSQVVPPYGVAANSLTGASCPTSNFGTTRLATDATTSSHDALGDVTVTESPTPNGQSATYETTTDTYDPDGRLIKTVSPSTDTTNDPNGIVTLNNYDAAGRLLATSTGAGSSLAVTSYCYDPDNDTTATVPPDGNSGATLGTDGLTLSGYASCSSSSPYQTTSVYETGYVFDSAGNELSVTRPATAAAPSGATTTDTYDSSSQLLTSNDPNGVTTTLSYNPLGELSTQSYSNSTPSVTDSYDANGELTKMVDGTGTSNYGYDAFGDVLSYENGASQTVSYLYNALGEPTSITYPLPTGTMWDTSSSATFTYDDAGLLKYFVDLKNSETKFAYTADELLNTVTFPSTVGTETLGYDNADDTDQVSTSSPSSLTYAYSFEPSGAIETETDTPTSSGVSPTYNYDTLGRVTTLTPGTGSATTYGYDESSNLTSLPAGTFAGDAGTYDDASELTAVAATGGSVALTYDADGERLTEKQGTTTLASSTWNGAGELTAYSEPAGTTMSAAAYDGSGLRESDTVGSQSQNFLWDASSPTSQLLEDGTNLYIYGPGATPVEELNLSTGNKKYLVSDGLGSVRAVLNGTTGGVLGSTSYDAYGNAASSGVSTYSPFGFAGGYTDATGLVYLIGRYYDPATGQFLSVDPLVDETDQPYAYTGGDPVNGADPSGDALLRTDTGENCVEYGGRTTACFGWGPLSADSCKALLRDETFETCSWRTNESFSQLIEGIGAMYGGTAVGAIGGLIGDVLDTGVCSLLARAGLIGGPILQELDNSGGGPSGVAASTGRTAAQNLLEQLAMQAAQADPAAGKVLPITMTDPRWPASAGWVKMQQIISGVNIHYVWNTVTGVAEDWKYK